MTDTPYLGLPLIEAAQAQKHVTHNEALALLDLLVQLTVESRALTAPPATPEDGNRCIVKATATGAFAGKENQIAQYSGSGWVFHPPRIGWLAFVADEGVLLAWDGSAWVSAVSSSGDISSLQDLTLLGVGTTADSTNPFSAKLNNALWVAKTVGEGGDGTLRYKLSKESAPKTLSFLFQDNFSGRAEIGLTGDDDFHFKVSPDGSTWIDALIIDKSTGSANLNAGFFLTGDISPAQITADQNDYNPTGLSTASVLRLNTDASRNITGLAGGGDGRIIAIVNGGTNEIVLKDASTSSGAANRFAFGADITLASKKSAVLWYDATDQRWKLLAAPQSGGGGGSGTVTSVGLALPAIFSVSGSPVTNSGTLTGTLATQSANAIWAGPASGAAANPTFRALVGADLPAPTASTFGGVQAKSAETSNWLRTLGTDGVLTASQPDFSNISGTAAISQGGTGATTASSARTNLGLGTAATLDVGTSANKVVQLDGSARLPAVDGSQLTNLPGGGGGGSVPADLDLLLAELALGLADALNGAQFLGNSGNRFADSFDTLTYVDVAGATNLSTSEAGVLKPTTSTPSDVFTGGTASASSAAGGGAASGAADNNLGSGSNQYWQANGNEESSGWWQYDLGSGVTKKLATWLQYWDGSSSGIETATIKASNTGSFGGEEATIAAVDFNLNSGAGWYGVNFTPPGTAYRYWRIYSNSTVNTFNTNRPLITEFEGLEQSAANNLTVKSATLTAAAAPTSMKAVARTEHVDTIALDTDYKISVSRDGGTTWSYATLNDRFTVNSIHVVESSAIDMTSQPTGTSVKWRIETANNKMVKTYDIYLYWT